MPNFTFQNLRVRSLSLDSLEVTWEIANTTLDPYDFTWEVLRSESPEGPWDPMAGPFSDRYRFLDDRVNLLHRWRQLYYRIRSTQKADPQNVEVSKSVTNIAEPDLIALEIQMLEQTVLREFNGRMCWLFPKRTFGQYCPHCMDISRGSTMRKLRSGCPTCIPTGEQITMADGTLRRIEDVTAGDLVLTHTGESREIIETMYREVRENICFIHTVGGKHLRATKNHPVLIVKENDCNCFHCDKRGLPVHESCPRHGSLQAQWVPISDVHIGDRVVSPAPVGTESPTWSEDRITLLGLYIAEGCVTEGRGSGRDSLRLVRFGLHRREEILANKIVSIAERLYKKTPKIYRQGENGLTVNLYDTEAAEWLAQHGGRYSTSKKLSQEAWSLPSRQALHLFGSYSDGDGCFYAGGRTVMLKTASASVQLAHQMYLMLRRCGVHATLRNSFHRDHRPGKRDGYIHLIEIYGVEIEKILPHKLLSVPYFRPNSTRRYVQNMGAAELLRVTKIGQEYYRGTVHNLEVEKDHSYVISDLAVHNCFDAQFARGYLDPIQLWIQFDPSMEADQQIQTGATQQSNTSARMGAYPIVKPDDIFVEIENRRWRVIRTSGTERLRAPVHQELTLHEIVPGDIEFELPVNVQDLAALEPSAERNFSNPQNLEAATSEEDILAILKAYGYKHG